MNLNSLPQWKKEELFIASGRKDFYDGGIVPFMREKKKYRKLGIKSPVYSLRGKFDLKRLYTLDSMADSTDAMLRRMVIW